MIVPDLWQDLRLAVRRLCKAPGFTAVAALTLALGIGSNTLVYSVADALLFRPLGFTGEDRLMWIRMVNALTGVREDGVSWQEMEDIKSASASFEHLATFGSSGAVWEHGDRTEQLPALFVTSNLAETLRVRPVLGRLFGVSDLAEAGDSVVVISYELWKERFNGSPDVLGQVLRLNEKPHTIVGVLPPGLHFPLERAPSAGTGSLPKPGVQAFWFPLDVRGEDRVSRGARMFTPVARLKPGVPAAAARAELAAVGARLAADHPETNRDWRFEMLSLRDQALGRTRQAIPVLGGAVAALLLICCVNLASLFLARGVTRQRELAVRLALGVGRWRLVQSFAVESLLVATLGGALGVALAAGGLHLVRSLAAEHVPFIRHAAVDFSVLGFAAGVSVLTAVVFGLAPALRLSRITAGDALRTGVRMTAGPQIRRYQNSFLIGQIAVVLVLLAGAALLLESFRRLLGQDLGYSPRSVVAMELNAWGFPTNGDMCQMYRSLQARIAALPGVEAVGTISSAPLTGKWTINEKAQVVGRPVAEADRPVVSGTFAAFDYFQAMGIPLLEGRYFRDSDLRGDGPEPQVIINQAAAAALFPGGSALGGRFTVGSNSDRALEVIGVVKDTRDVRLEDQPQARLYWHYAFGGAQVVVRSALPLATLVPQLRAAVLATDSRVRFESAASMNQIVSRTVAERRFFAAMISSYALLALGVSALGIFGVLAYQVAHRTNELGVRLALGATPAGLARLILVQAGRVIVAGLVAGLMLSYATNQILASQLFQVSPQDPMLLAIVSFGVLLVGLCAAWLPARRAIQVDPIASLRCD